MVERTNAAFEGDIRLTVQSNQLVVGDVAPAFALDALDQQRALAVVALADS